VEFEDRAKKAIKEIPRGKVATYAQVAALAGNYRADRQVVRVLHASSEKDRLPWHRIINSRGGISLKRGRGFEEQRRLLLKEGVRVSRLGRIDLQEFQWEPQGARTRARAEKKVVRVLHSSSEKDRLPWHRVINSRGGISLKRGRGFEEQRRLLLREGVRVSRLGRIDLQEFQWEPQGARTRARAEKKFLRELTK